MTDEDYMTRALAMAKAAETAGEVPVGAVLVFQGEIIAETFNQPISLHDPCAHAEVLALRQSAKKLNNYRLLGSTLYVTLEPCAMCATALVHARIKRLVYGAADPKSGAVSSHLQLLDSPIMNHRIDYQGGVKAEESTQLLQNFFKLRRNKSLS